MRQYLKCVLFVVVAGFSCPGNGENDYASGYRNYNSRPYSYSYAVSSPQTGDHKSQWETRENGVVRGSYSLLQPDGTTRVVDYTADHTGFHPTVRVLANPSYDLRRSDPTYYNYYRPQYYNNYNRRFYPDNYQNNFYHARGAQVQPPLSASAYHGYDNLYH